MDSIAVSFEMDSNVNSEMEEKHHMPGRSFWQTTFSRPLTALQLMDSMLRHIWSI